MTEETRIALMNYDCMIRSRGLDYAELCWDSGMLAYGDGGSDIDMLCRPGFTPATTAEGIAALLRGEHAGGQVGGGPHG